MRQGCEMNRNAVCGSYLRSLKEIHNINPSWYFYFWVNLLENRIWVSMRVFYRLRFIWRLLNWCYHSALNMELDRLRKCIRVLLNNTVQAYSRSHRENGWSASTISKPDSFRGKCSRLICSGFLGDAISSLELKESTWIFPHVGPLPQSQPSLLFQIWHTEVRVRHASTQWPHR